MRIIKQKDKLIFSITEEESKEFAKLKGEKGLVKIPASWFPVISKDVYVIMEEYLQCTKK